MSQKIYYTMLYDDLNGGTFIGPYCESKEQLVTDKQYLRGNPVAILRVKPKPKICNHSWVNLWNDYYSWGAECEKCGLSKTGDY